jgi:hypothetical protein
MWRICIKAGKGVDGLTFIGSFAQFWVEERHTRNDVAAEVYVRVARRSGKGCSLAIWFLQANNVGIRGPQDTDHVALVGLNATVPYVESHDAEIDSVLCHGGHRDVNGSGKQNCGAHFLFLRMMIGPVLQRIMTLRRRFKLLANLMQCEVLSETFFMGRPGWLPRLAARSSTLSVEFETLH